MTDTTQRLKERFYRNEDHPYRIFESRVASTLKAGDTLLDAGCGRTAPVLSKYRGIAGRLIGVDLVDPKDVTGAIEYFKADLAALPLPDESVDLIISRSVFEHLVDPDSVYREAERVLKPGGKLIFLTANLWDYATLIARMVPNRLHSKVVKAVEGRPEEDTFPTAYKTNSAGDIRRLAEQSGLQVRSIEYLNQYPNYFMFNAALFMVGVGYERLTSRLSALQRLRGWLLVVIEKS